IGGKFVLFERRMSVDAAIYHIDWRKLPVGTGVAGGNGFCNWITNAGAATSDGAEFQARLLAVKGLQLDFGAGYTKAQLSADAPYLGAKKGARLPGSPKASTNLAAQYDFDIAGHRAFARADSFYTGKFYGDLLETPTLAAGDYVKIDARVG